MAKSKRSRLFIDIEVQVALMWRVAMYWVTFAVAIMLMQFCWIVFTGRPTSSLDLLLRSLASCGPAIVASTILLPLILVDCLKVSHRFVGPIFRLRRALRDLSLGRPVEPIHLRQGDFWRELIEDFNRLANKENLAETPEESLTT